MARKLDLIGKRFGRLRVIEDAPDHIQSNGRHRRRVLCRCDCGNEKIVSPERLRNGHTQSCGCLRRELTSRRFSKKIKIGTRFGRLVVKKESPRNTQGSNRKYFVCQCDCGKVFEVLGTSLRIGNTQSCGCYKRDRASDVLTEDLTGQVFGRLTAIKQVSHTRDKRVRWLCECSCGALVKVRARDFKSGNTKSCGCYHRDMVSGDNNYNWRGGVAPIKNAVQETKEYKDFRQAVFERDDFTCQVCGVVREGIQVHHIYPFDSHEELRICEDNGITLCEHCHIGVKKNNPNSFHRTYGTRGCTAKNFVTWYLAMPQDLLRELGWVK